MVSLLDIKNKTGLLMVFTKQKQNIFFAKFLKRFAFYSDKVNHEEVVEILKRIT